MEYNEKYFGSTGGAERDASLEPLARSLVEQFHPSTSLDIGCGQGFLVHHLRQMGVEAHGVDISPYALSVAPGKVRPHLFRVDLGEESIPFESRSIDVVTAIEVMEHIGNLDHVIAEIKRVLKPEGLVFMTSPLPLVNSRLGQFLLGRGWRPLDRTHVNVHGRHFWKKEFQRHGFRYEGTFKQLSRRVPAAFWPTKLLSRLSFAESITSSIRGWYLFRLRSE